MFKVGYILILLVIYGSGCSVIKRSANTVKNKNEGIRLNELSEDIEAFNITNNNFYIKKAELEIISNEEKQKLLGSVKYKQNGEYLISIRLRSGIEAARFYISNDTILINDRINRKIYKGSADYIEKKYGISGTFLPALFGDFKKEENTKENDKICVNGKIEIERRVRNNNIKMNIDCNREKLSEIKIGSEDGKDGIRIKFENYYSKKNKRFPKSIMIEDLINKSTIMIRIDRIEIPWDGIIDFVAGRNYEIEKLQ